jgi:hypothetical protein
MAAGKHRKPNCLRRFWNYWTTEETPTPKTAKNVIKYRRHLLCIAVGIIAAIGSTYLGDAGFHIAPALPIIPSIAQEIVDRIRDL